MCTGVPVALLYSHGVLIVLEHSTLDVRYYDGLDRGRTLYPVRPTDCKFW